MTTQESANQAADNHACDEKTWQENVVFWEKAWSGVKKPYTQMPDLAYLPTIAQRLADFKAKRVMDLGCGSGWLSIYLARAGFSVEGIDIAPQAITLGQMWAEQEKLPIKFSTGDIINMSFPANSFDAVVANSIFEHLTKDLAHKTLKQIKSLLSSEGVFFGCFDKVGGGPGEYFELADHTHVYTDKGRKGMILRCFSDDELKALFSDWKIVSMETLESGSRLIWAKVS